MDQQQTALKNIVGEEEIALNKQFLLFPQCFLLNQITVNPFSIFLISYLYLLLSWKSLNKHIREGLTLSHIIQTFNDLGQQGF